ncbi:hypothetical protein CRYUN_Cryun02cG0152200 [Craigia yunnanensis]
MVAKDQILPDVLTCNVLINGFCRNGKVDKARKIMEFMKNNGCSPNLFNYFALMNGFCKEGRWAAQIDEAMELLKEKECQADVVTLNVLLGGLCREDRFHDALQMLEKLPYEGVYLNKASYRIVLNSLCQKDEMEKATKLLGLMLDRGFFPHYATSNEMLIRL